MAIEKKRLVLLGKDPIEERKQERQAAILEQAKSISFELAATECIEAKRAEWSNKKHAAQWTSTLETYAYPIIGSLSINEIETNHVLSSFQKLTSAPTAIHIQSIDLIDRKDYMWGQYLSDHIIKHSHYSRNRNFGYSRNLSV